MSSAGRTSRNHDPAVKGIPRLAASVTRRGGQAEPPLRAGISIQPRRSASSDKNIFGARADRALTAKLHANSLATAASGLWPWRRICLKGAIDKVICDFREVLRGNKERDSDPAELPFHACPGPKQKKLLLFFPLPCRFFLDIDETQFYTFINCNLRIAEIDATHRKGE